MQRNAIFEFGVGMLEGCEYRIMFICPQSFWNHLAITYTTPSKHLLFKFLTIIFIHFDMENAMVVFLSVLENIALIVLPFYFLHIEKAWRV
jgi:hypothetical protein